MRIFCIVALVLVLSFFGFDVAFADESAFKYEYASEIVAVDFYPSGAKFTFKYKPSENDFEFAIPGAFNADSVRAVDAKNSGANIQARSVTRAEWIPDYIRELNSQVEAHSKKIQELNYEKEALEQTISFLKNTKPKDSDAGGLLNFIKESQVLRQETNNRLLAVNNKLNDERKILKILEAERSSKLPARNDRFVLVTGNANAEFLFEAFTSYADWNAKYTLDLDSKSGDIKAQMFAKISQRTGLDYEGKITLHTKTPDERIVEPKILPLKASFQPKVERVTAAPGSAPRFDRMSMRMKMDSAANYEAASEPEEDYDALDMMLDLGSVENRQVQSMTESLSDRAIELFAKLTGDGRESNFEIHANEINLTSEPEILLIPEQRRYAWIVANMDVVNNTRLIPGEAELRVDGNPSGKIVLSENSLSKREMPFGYIEQITCERNLITEKVSSSTFFSNNEGRTSGYVIKITNGSNQDRKITVKDRLPIPTNDKITLDVKSINPAEKSRDKDNILTWELDVKAGESVEISVDYSLKYPSSETLQFDGR